MYLLFTDETNLPSDPRAEFFAYGGLIIHADRLPALTARIAAIRKDAGYKPDDSLKFQTNARPDYVSIPNATRAKERVIEACQELDCKFIAYVILHAIAQNYRDNLITYAANSVLAKFNGFLREQGDHGVCVVDRLPQSGEYDYLTEKFCRGLTMLDGKEVKLDRIHLFASSCDNASHASSAVDIALGAFRHCINSPKKTELVAKMMKNVARLLLSKRLDGKTYVRGVGLLVRPKDIRSAAHQAKYDALVEHMDSLLLVEEAPPPGRGEPEATASA